MGSRFSVTRERGKLLHSDWAGPVMATVHPSSVLRASTGVERERARREFFADMAQVKRFLRSKAS
jgi:DNA polymerase